MEKIYLKVNDGEYDCDLKINEEKWIEILKDSKVTKLNYKFILLMFFGEPEHKSTCTDIGLKYHFHAQYVNVMVTSFCEAVQKTLNCYEIYNEGKITYWPFAMIGKRLSNGPFEWRLRPELAKALEKCHLSWIPFYMEFADKLISFKEKRDELINIVYNADKQYINNLYFDGARKLSDICPFSVMSIFNKGMTDENRRGAAEYFKKVLGIKAPLPNDFDAIPVMMSQQANFFGDKDAKEEIPILWEMFEAEIKNDQERMNECFDSLEHFKGMKWNLTMGMYWIRPYDYIALDSNNREYLNRCGIKVFDEKEIDSQNYFSLLNEVKGKINNKIITDKDIPSMSYNAWRLINQKEGDYKMKSYLLAGFNFNGNESQYDRFIKENIWEGYFNKDKDKKQIELVKSLKEGDVIALKTVFTKGSKHNQPCMRIYAVGTIINLPSEGYDEENYHVTINVDYSNTEQQEFDGPSYGKYRKTIYRTDDNSIIDYIESKIAESHKKNPLADQYAKLLQSVHNIVLTGAPGTGKTYLAYQIVDSMDGEMEFVQFHPSYDYTDFVEGLRPTRSDNASNIGFERTDGIFKRFCKRALQNYLDSQKTEEELKNEKTIKDRVDDFVNDAVINNKEFQLVTGTKFQIVDSDEDTIYIKASVEIANDIHLNKSVLTDILSHHVSLDKVSNIKEYFNRRFNTQQDSYIFVLCTEIYKSKETHKQIGDNVLKRKNFVFIIDEINRGELSKIFGELFFSIDPGYRFKGMNDNIRKVKTQYQNLIDEKDLFSNGFFIPDNVFIIGTMNDIDRSVESMDFAMRRRFTWKQIDVTATQYMLDNLPLKDEAIKKMNAINNAIVDSRINLGKEYQIGASYFLNLNTYQNEEKPFDCLWNNHLEPLVSEYLRGIEDIEGKIDIIKNAYDQGIYQPEGQSSESEM